MELKEYFKIIKQNILLIFLTVAVFLAGGIIYYFYQTKFYIGEAVFSVTQASENENIDFGIYYDGYYLIESQRNFGRRIGNLLFNQSKLKNEYKTKGINEFTVKQLNDFDYKVILKSKEENEINKIFDELNKNLAAEIKKLSRGANEKIIFSALMHSKQIKKIDVNLAALAGFLAFSGLIFGIIAIFFRHYFKK